MHGKDFLFLQVEKPLYLRQNLFVLGYYQNEHNKGGKSGSGYRRPFYFEIQYIRRAYRYNAEESKDEHTCKTRTRSFFGKQKIHAEQNIAQGVDYRKPGYKYPMVASHRNAHDNEYQRKNHYLTEYPGVEIALRDKGEAYAEKHVYEAHDYHYRPHKVGICQHVRDDAGDNNSQSQRDIDF